MSVHIIEICRLGGKLKKHRVVVEGHWHLLVKPPEGAVLGCWTETAPWHLHTRCWFELNWAFDRRTLTHSQRENQWFGKVLVRRNDVLQWFTIMAHIVLCLVCFLTVNIDQCPKLRFNHWLPQPGMFIWKNTNWLKIHTNHSKLGYTLFL